MDGINLSQLNQRPPAKKLYLGDAVYVEVRDGQFVLTTEDGVSISNTIFLERTTYDALQLFVQQYDAGELK